ncbi:PQQ-dependent sugar dehydrogenase [Pelagicoccus sp. SDUM812003]|uniref:PQQ-dependent sugar dehydrogenase n=1 Tax=Pelagicoccus sp. SDUM812003 TaxID=3041267 RepID=UPI00280E93F7|nr:PQQ-dependent sugar dehydrogenase [Pelagicoccus sp. SDUM812003]MDQ8203099.1 PQQ-dependent sugar dehydrogenase [Pelagicoccus sp. SDUM812003]
MTLRPTFVAIAISGAFAAGASAQIVVPEGFSVSVFADGLDGIRGLAVSPDGNVYGKVRGRGVVAMQDKDGDGNADVVKTVPGTPEQGSGIGFHDGFLYYSTDSSVHRMKLPKGQLMPSGKAETVVSGLVDRQQHASKMFTFDPAGNLYVEVGAPSNSLGEPDRAPGAEGLSDEAVREALSQFGGIWRFDPNTLNQSQEDGYHYSTGHRHVLTLDWQPKADALFVVQNGRDVINVVDPTFSVEYNAERVAEEMHVLRQGSNLGWPYTYYDPIDKVRLFSPEYGGDGEKQPEAGRFQEPSVAFPAHWAPMQMAYYGGTSFPQKYHGGMFVAFHGSWNRAPVQKGYNVCFIPVDDQGLPTGDYEVFADGFIGKERIVSPGQADYRPMGVAVGPDGALYIGSDQGGRVWKVSY